MIEHNETSPLAFAHSDFLCSLLDEHQSEFPSASNCCLFPNDKQAATAVMNRVRQALLRISRTQAKRLRMLTCGSSAESWEQNDARVRAPRQCVHAVRPLLLAHCGFPGVFLSRRAAPSGPFLWERAVGKEGRKRTRNGDRRSVGGTRAVEPPAVLDSRSACISSFLDLLYVHRIHPLSFPNLGRR